MTACRRERVPLTLISGTRWLNALSRFRSICNLSSNFCLRRGFLCRRTMKLPTTMSSLPRASSSVNALNLCAVRRSTSLSPACSTSRRHFFLSLGRDRNSSSSSSVTPAPGSE